VIGGDGGLLNHFDGHVVLRGGCAAVFELGGGVVSFVIAAAEFDADVAVGCGDSGVGAVEAGATLVMDADAEGAGLAEEEVFEGGCVGVIGEDGDVGGPSSSGRRWT
jgi:hypothetical protein